MGAQQFSTTWNDAGQESGTNAPLDSVPAEIDISNGAPRTCTARLDRAPRCGAWLVECQDCGAAAAVAVFGRADDPASITFGCAVLRAGAQPAPASEPELPKPAPRYRAVAGQRALF